MRTMAFMAVAAGLLASPALAAGKPEKPAVRLPVMAPPAPLLATPPLTPDNTLLLDLSTGGRVTIQMRPVIDGFMAQGGDPTGTGTGGSKLPNLKAEFNTLPHVRGAVAMARAGDKDSANSQFYIVLQPVLKLDGTYTVWGRVTSGMEQVDAIEKGEPPANPSKIVHAAIAVDGVPALPGPMTPIPPPVAPTAKLAPAPLATAPK